MLTSITVWSVLATALTVLVAAAESDLHGYETIPGAYIVEFDEGQNTDSLRLQAAPGFDTRLDLNYNLFRGASIQLHDTQNANQIAATLAELPAVKNIWPVRTIPGPELPERVIGESADRLQRLRSHSLGNGNGTSVPYSTHVMTQVDKLHARGITGNGIRIAVVDSGVDYEHPVLGGCFGEDCIVRSGYDFVGDDYMGTNTPVPDSDPMDCMGHGTHVAGIISARDNEWGFRGAAPGAELSVYRVFGCEGGSSDDILIAAFNRAYEDGANIITSSIGSNYGWQSAPWSLAVSRIVEMGVPCTLSAGNNGYDGLFRPQSAAAGKGVTTVAAFENSVLPSALVESYYNTDNGSRIAFPYDYGFPDAFDGVPRPLWAVRHGALDACEPLPADTPDLSEYHVLVRRGNCDYSQQAENVAARGAQFLVVYNNASGTESINAQIAEGILAVGMVPQDVGETWVASLEAGSNVTTEFIHYQDAEVYIYVQPDDGIRGSVYAGTSWGPTYEMEAKPQIGAPGGAILSTYPLNQGGFDVLSGTSMACPFDAAAFALVAEARGTLDPALIESLLAATSNPQLFMSITSGRLAYTDYLAPPPQQGAGLIQVYDAAYGTTVLQPSSLSFNDTDHFAEALNFTLTNNGTEESTYEIAHLPTHSFYALQSDLETPNRYPTSSVDEHAELVFSESRITITSGSSATISVVATPPQQLDVSRYGVWSGYITINGSDGSALSLLYQGLQGSLHNATVMTEENAYLTLTTDGSPITANTTLTLPPRGTNPDPFEAPIPQLVVNLYWGTPVITADIVPLANSTPPGGVTESIGQPADFPVLWPSRSWWYWTWYGQLNNGAYAPAGRYKIIIKALRIFGDESNENDWFVSETPPFQIVYQE